MTETPSPAGVVTARVLAFARLRELLGFGERLVTVPPGTTLDGLWSQLAANAQQRDGDAHQLAGLRASTRFARNGELAAGNGVLCDGDEIALLPPVGGG